MSQPAPVALDPSAMKPIDVQSPALAPSAVARPESIAIPPPPDFAATIKLVKSPADAPSVDLLASVHLDVDLVGALAGEVTVDWVPPSGAVFDRHSQQVNGTRYTAQHAGFDLLVAGTWIEQHAISGTWTARVRLGDRELAAVPFEIPAPPAMAEELTP